MTNITDNKAAERQAKVDKVKAPIEDTTPSANSSSVSVKKGDKKKASSGDKKRQEKAKALVRIFIVLDRLTHLRTHTWRAKSKMNSRQGLIIQDNAKKAIMDREKEKRDRKKARKNGSEVVVEKAVKKRVGFA